MSRPSGAKTRSTSAPSAKPESIYRSRLDRLGEAIANADLAALLVTNPKDVGYLTGFHGGDSYLVVPTDVWRSNSTAVLITDFRYQEEARPVADAALAELHVRDRSMVEAVADVLGPAPKKGEVKIPAGGAAATRARLGAEPDAFPWRGGAGDQRIGIQAEHLSVAEKAAIGRRVGVKRLIDTTGLVSALRLIKDAGEIELIKKAVKIQEAALKAVLPALKTGATELEIAARLEMEMKSRGSSEPGFQTIVASGASSALPHYRPHDRKIPKTGIVLIDWGAVFQGYHSDMTRVVALGGKWPRSGGVAMDDIYKLVLEAHEAAAAALAPGKTSKETDAVARRVIEDAGHGDHFGHGLGHGLGLNGHEDPRLTNMLAGMQLRPGMVVTIEPGIYLPGIGGVRIEDDYVITETGAQNLCSLPKSLEWSTL